MIKCIIPLLAGMLCNKINLKVNPWQIWYLYAILLAVGILSHVHNKNGLKNKRSLTTYYFVIYFIAGFSLISFKTYKPESDLLLKINSNEKVIWYGTIIGPVNYDNKQYRFNAFVYKCFTENKWIHVNGTFRLKIKGLQLNARPESDDKIIFYSDLISPSITPNPGMTDVKLLMENSGVTCTASPEPINIRILKSSEITLKRFAGNCRNELLNILNKQIRGKQELGVSAALILGFEDWLDQEVESEYKSAGVLHVLCVSGMHISLVFITLNKILKPLFQFKGGNLLINPLLIGTIWFYALITGFSPSVVRAASMTTFVIGSEWVGRKVDIRNLLCGSCLLLFLLNPFIIYNAGFQLSFFAMCGIIFIHPIIMPLFPFNNKIIFKICELISISISAQLSTFPLSIYLFHQFPNYFLLGNLIIVPLSTIAMYAGIILLMVTKIPFVADGFTIGTEFIFKMLNLCVRYLSRLPGSVTEEISIEFIELILLYLLIITMIRLIVKPYYHRIILSCVVGTLFLTCRIIINYQSTKLSELIVFNSGKSPMLALKYENKCRFYIWNQESSNYNDKIASAYRTKMRLQKSEFSILKSNRVVYFKNFETALVIDWQSKTIPENESIPKVKYLILSGSISIPINQIISRYHPETIIMDRSCRFNISKKAKAAPFMNKVHLIRISKSGPFRINFRSAGLI